MPPAALMSAAAWSTPFFICAPVAALGPVIGPPTPNLTWAPAVPATVIAMLSAKPSVPSFFICCSPPTRRGTPNLRNNTTSGQFAAPAHCTGGFVEPSILIDHLRGTRGPESPKCEGDAEYGVDQIVME